MSDTAVALIVFNRPELTRRVMTCIRASKPSKLFVIADGARPAWPADVQLVREVRRIIEAMQDWPCEVVWDAADSNLGCARRVASGLEHVFSDVEEAIVLEDDCLPDATFFRFCAELLARYRNDPRVAHIGGANFQRSPHADSYYYSRYNHIWGWATWRRAWSEYDATLHDWPEVRQSRWLRDFLGDRAAARYWTGIFDAVTAGEVCTWDYQWTYTLWRRGWLSVTPGVNLVQNIGFDGCGTHLSRKDSWLSRSAGQMTFPLRHLTGIARDRAADALTERTLFSGGTMRRLKRMVRGWLRPKTSFNRHGSSEPGVAP